MTVRSFTLETHTIASLCIHASPTSKSSIPETLNDGGRLEMSPLNRRGRSNEELLDAVIYAMVGIPSGFLAFLAT